MPVARATFEVVPCDAFEDGDRRLIADYAIDCETPKHKLHRALAFASTAIVVVGQPVCLMIMLYLGKVAKAKNQHDDVLVVIFDVLSEARRRAEACGDAF